MGTGPTTTGEEPERSVPVPRLGTLRPPFAPVLMVAVVTVAAAVPLLQNTIFYYWDDSAAAATPVWRRLGEALLERRLPLLEIDMWRGGNLAAEAATGMWNPIVVALAVATHPIDNMALAMTVIKTFFMLVMAVGSYLLAREYGVRSGLAAAMGAAMPLAGYSFFMDATSWINALMLTAFLPWVWLAGRRVLHHGNSILWLVLAGYLTCSLGNPYALLATGFLVFAMLIEAWVLGKRGLAIRMALAGVAILALNVLVYLPLLMTTSVGVRASSTTFNDEFFSPNLTNMLGISTPTGQPWVHSFGQPFLVFPAMYLAWFILPTLPWLRWGSLRGKWRSLTAVGVFGGISLLLVLGPSNLWMFRWPLRLIDFLWFPVMLIWAVLANEGLDRSHARLKYVASGALIALGAYLAWADLPQHLIRIGVGTALVTILVGLLLRLGLLTRPGTVVLLLGTLIVLALQVHYYPKHIGVADYRFPTSQELITKRFAKYQGLTVQVASTGALTEQDKVPDRAYQDMIFGTLYSTAGVESTTGYTGIGFNKLDNALCMAYEGSTCRDAWRSLWQPPPGAQVPLADLLRAQTVVVQNSLIDTRSEPPPAGWRRAPEKEATELVTVWVRTAPLPWPEGRVSHLSDTVQVITDQRVGSTGERLTFQATGPGDITFARLNWPGYTATVNDVPATIRTGPAGLVVVDLPPGVTSGELALSWHMPGKPVSIAAFVLGLLLCAGLVLVPALARRRGHPARTRSRQAPPSENDQDAERRPETEPAGTPAMASVGDPERRE
jgi:hypothetical protein